MQSHTPGSSINLCGLLSLPGGDMAVWRAGRVPVHRTCISCTVSTMVAWKEVSTGRLWKFRLSLRI